MRSVAAISFDLDGTLLAYDTPIETVLTRSFDACGVAPFFTVGEYLERFDDHVDSGRSIDDVRADCFADLARERGLDAETGRDVAAAYASQRRQTDVSLYSGVEDLLATLHDTYALALVTNGPRGAQAKKIAATDLDRWFDVVVYADNEVPAKPDPAPFRRALDELRVAAEQAAHVGNSLASDVRGAAAVGMITVWVDGGETPDDEQADYRIASAPDMLDLPIVR